MNKLRITIDGRAYDVTVESLESFDEVGSPKPISPPPKAPPISASASAAAAGAVASPLAGRIVSIDCKVGQHVEAGVTLATLEAMKMNAFVVASTPGTVTSVLIAVGDAVSEGQVLFTLQ